MASIVSVGGTSDRNYEASIHIKTTIPIFPLIEMRGCTL
jgi:hypothetical protein